MTHEEAFRLARQLFHRHNLFTFEFGLDNARRRRGLCTHPHGGRPGRITLSRHFVASARPEAVRGVLLHEIAHALVGPGHGHDAVWRAMCRAIGGDTAVCARTEGMPLGPWRAVCRGCGQVRSRFRRPMANRAYACRDCGWSRGKLEGWAYHGPVTGN